MHLVTLEINPVHTNKIALSTNAKIIEVNVAVGGMIALSCVSEGPHDITEIRCYQIGQNIPNDIDFEYLGCVVIKKIKRFVFRRINL